MFSQSDPSISRADLGPAPKEVRAELERVLAHPLFTNASRLSRMLRYLVDQSLLSFSSEVKEYTIGLDVFDRDPSFDPRQDSVVRANATRLRAKLIRYFESDGKDDPLLIELRRGSYRPVFQRRTPRAEESVVSSASEMAGVDRSLMVTARLEGAARLESPARTEGTVGAAGPRQRHIASLWRVLSVAAALAAVLAAGAWNISRKPRVAAIGPHPFFSLLGLKRTPVFSPDGQTIAFEWRPEGQANTALYLQRIDADTPTRLTNTAEAEIASAWSPDGRQIAFFRQHGDRNLSLISVPVNGGPEHLWAEVQSRPTLDIASLDWTPDGRYFVAVDQSKGDPMAVVLISTATGRKYWITSPPVGTLGDGPVQVSPDGRWIAFRRTVGASTEDLFLMPFPDSEAALNGDGERTVRRLTNDGRPVHGMAWTPDSRTIILSSSRAGGRPSLYRVPLDGGDPVRIPEPGLDTRMPTMSRKGNRLMWIAESIDVSLWRIPVTGGTPVRLISSSGLNTEPQYSPDGSRIAFRSNRTGSDELWSSDAAGASLRRLTNFRGPLTGTGRWSPDGTRLVFETRIGNVVSLCLANFGGDPNCAVDPGGNAGVPSWSRDGKWIYFGSNREDGVQVWKRPSGGGAAIRVTHGGGFEPFESPDGAYVYYSRGANGKGLWRVPTGGGEETAVFADLPNNCWGDWAITQEGVYYIGPVTESPAETRYALYFLDPATKAKRLIAPIDGTPVRWDSALAASPDGRFLLFARLDRDDTDLMVAEDFK